MGWPFCLMIKQTSACFEYVATTGHLNTVQTFFWWLCSTTICIDFVHLMLSLAFMLTTSSTAALKNRITMDLLSMWPSPHTVRVTERLRAPRRHPLKHRKVSVLALLDPHSTWSTTTHLCHIHTLCWSVITHLCIQKWHAEFLKAPFLGLFIPHLHAPTHADYGKQQNIQSSLLCRQHTDLYNSTRPWFHMSTQQEKINFLQFSKNKTEIIVLL